MASTLSMREVCLIDAGISDVRDLALAREVETLNLHCNSIQSISGLGNLSRLRHLDLSSNAITTIIGLDELGALRTLNLSCNLISEVTGLEKLQSLTHLNLSYNQVRTVQGLQDLWGHQLRHLELQGNELSSIEELIECLSGLASLEELTLQREGSSNPICQLYGYRTALLNSLPQLKVLDGRDRRGRAQMKESTLNDVPGLEQYLDFLVSSDANTSTSQENPLQLITPKIDQLLDKFRRGALRGAGPSTSNPTTSHSERESTGRDQYATKMTQQPHGQPRAAVDHENRILELEKRLSDMLERKNNMQLTVQSEVEERQCHAYPTGQRGGRQRKIPKRDTEPTDESEQSDSSERRTSSTGKPRKNLRRSGPKKGKLKKQLSNSDPSIQTSGKQKSERRSGSKEKKADKETKSTVEQDTEKLTLLQELDQERVRRWKAEQAAMKLADRIKVLQTVANEGHEIQSVAVHATGRIKEVLMREKENRLKLEEERDNLKGSVAKLIRKLEEAVGTFEEKDKALVAMETTAKRMESDRLQQQAHTAKQLQEYQLKLGASSRELDLLRTQVKNSEVKIHQLQELLATREQEHRNEVKQLYRLDSRELQDMLKQQREREREAHHKEVMMNQRKIDDLTKQYGDLEDEFRLALRLEADRYKQIFDAYESSQLKEVKLRDVAETATLKEKRASALVTELTAMVKQQKGRISELSKSKMDVTSKSKDQVQSLEAHLEEARKKLLQLEAISKEKIRLQTQLVAQESVIEGLKAERKLWGQELAQQGASLAQDRGRLESKIEALTAEVESLKKQQVSDNEALKIKTKVIDDQTDTIRKLKEGLKEKDDQIKRVREESLGIQRSLEEAINEEQTARQDLKDQVQHLEERKEALKAQLQEVQMELDESQRSYRALDRKWKDKGDLISQLEGQVREVKKSFEDKEGKLKAERDTATEQERACKERMQKMDNAFRKQMEAAQQGYDESYEQLCHQRDNELKEANNKVLQVEEEMRLVLSESANQKQVMEDKLRKVTKVFSDLQQDMG